MARGWESKAVEDQQQAAESRTVTTAAVDPVAAGRAVERATLQLSRTRALADLQRACAPAHRAMLEQAIRTLDERIAALG